MNNFQLSSDIAEVRWVLLGHVTACCINTLPPYLQNMSIPTMEYFSRAYATRLDKKSRADP